MVLPHGYLARVVQRVVLTDGDPDDEAACCHSPLGSPAAGECRRHGRWTDGVALARRIVYTSGTSGRPKGVMLRHRNMLWNAAAAERMSPVTPDDLFLSFLPLSHTLERTVGYYLPMLAGAPVAFGRGIQQLADDLRAVRPTVLVSVPRVFERSAVAIRSAIDARGPAVRWLFERMVDLGGASSSSRSAARLRPRSRRYCRCCARGSHSPCWRSSAGAFAWPSAAAPRCRRTWRVCSSASGCHCCRATASPRQARC